MGPVRRRLTLAAATLVPTQAFAHSCADQRPTWVPGTEVTAVTEAIALFSSPVALILVLASALCLRFRSQWGTLLVVLLWTGFVSLIAFTDAGGRSAGMAEGCIGSPSLFIAIVVGLCALMILYTAPRTEKGTGEDT